MHIRTVYPVRYTQWRWQGSQCHMTGWGDDLGVLENSFTDSTEVVNLFETDSYRQMVELQWDWAQKGLLMPDGASNTDNEFFTDAGRKGIWALCQCKTR